MRALTVRSGSAGEATSPVDVASKCDFGDAFEGGRLRLESECGHADEITEHGRGWSVLRERRDETSQNTDKTRLGRIHAGRNLNQTPTPFRLQVPHLSRHFGAVEFQFPIHSMIKGFHMPESKIEATHRLQRDGRWTAACEFRDRVRRELRQAGKTKGEANDEAWRRMSEEFPPITVTQQGQSKVDLVADDGDDFPTNLPPSDGDFDADLRWAWNTIGDPVQPEDARNGSAWCLRLFGLQQFDKFLPLVAKSIGMADTRAKKMRADRDRQFAILAALQAEFAAQEESGAAGAGSNA